MTQVKTPMRSPHSLTSIRIAMPVVRLQTAFSLSLALLSIAFLSSNVQACQPYWTAAYKCAQGCGCGGGDTPPSYNRGSSDDDHERRERQRSYDNANDARKAGDAAQDAGDLAKALTHYQAMLRHPDFNTENNRKVVSSLQARIQADDARKAGNAAHDAGDLAKALTYYQVMLRNPDFNNEKNRKYVSDLQAHLDADNARKAGIAAEQVGDLAKALTHYQVMLRSPDFNTENNRKYVSNLQARIQAENERQIRIKKDAELEQRHRPKVESLRMEARSLIYTHPAQALLKLDEALKLLPGDPKTTADRWLVKASLELSSGNYDEALGALMKAEAHSDPGDIVRFKQRITDERTRQGADVQNAFATTRRRLETPGGSIDPGAQLRSIEQSSRDALNSSAEGAKKTASEGFDTPGKNQGDLVYVDKRQQQRPASELDKQIPKGAKDDPEVRQMQAWYWSLNGKKSDAEREVAALREQQKSSNDPILATKIRTLDNDINRLAEDQARATGAVKERVAVIKKRTLDRGLNWDESPAFESTASKANEQALTSVATTLDFVKD